MSKLKVKAKSDLSRVGWDFDQDQRFLLAWQSNIDLFLRSLHTSRNYMFKTSCIGRESNPGLPRGRREFYHWTTNALEYRDKAGNRIIKLHLQAYFSLCGLSYIFHPKKKQCFLPVGELNPGLPRDRRGYSPLYYRGLDISSFKYTRCHYDSNFRF